jgi:hypothetical protein
MAYEHPEDCYLRWMALGAAALAAALRRLEARHG